MKKGNVFTERTSIFLVWIGVILFVIGIVLFVWNDSLIDSDNLIKAEKFGQFGDFFGGLIGSLWALSGVILFYVALNTQREDFKTNQIGLKTQLDAFKKQVEEFELQREELKLTRQVFKEQHGTLKLQQFESTFFSMVNLHHQVVNSIDITTNKIVGDGVPQVDERTLISRDCFKFFENEFRTNYYEKKDRSYILDDIETRLKNSYLEFYRVNEGDLGHYFRNLYNILKFIKRYEKDEKDLFYSNLLRAQLSSFELLLLFYHCLSDNANVKFKPLIEKYHFFHDIPKDLIIESERAVNLYEQSAFA